MSVRGKVAVITGASSGIGRAAAKLLAGRGAFVVLGSRSESALQAVAGEITSAGGKAVFKATDVRHRGELEELVALAVERGGRLDVMVSPANGVQYTLPLNMLWTMSGTC